MNIQLLPARFDVAPLKRELDSHAHVWDRYRWRTEHPKSPHREASDIWVRYNAIDRLGPDFNEPHEATWYPVADELPAARSLAQAVMSEVHGIRLGGVLITKIPAGKQVYPHVDRGWHAEYYEKFAVQVASAPGQMFCFPDTTLAPQIGELYRFNNQAPHWVVNPSKEDRITLIVCIRRAH